MTALEQLTERQKLEKHRRGERLTNLDAPYSLFAKVSPEGSEACSRDGGRHRWRCILCTTDSDGDSRDVCECTRCGEQREMACDFDEDMS